MSKYGYLEVFLMVPSISRYRESTVYVFVDLLNANIMIKKLYVKESVKTAAISC